MCLNGTCFKCYTPFVCDKKKIKQTNKYIAKVFFLSFLLQRLSFIQSHIDIQWKKKSIKRINVDY